MDKDRVISLSARHSLTTDEDIIVFANAIEAEAIERCHETLKSEIYKALPGPSTELALRGLTAIRALIEPAAEQDTVTSHSDTGQIGSPALAAATQVQTICEPVSIAPLWIRHEECW